MMDLKEAIRETLAADNPASAMYRGRGGVNFSDIKFEISADGPPLEQCNRAVRRVLEARGKQYTPREGQSQVQAKMNDAVMAAIKPFLPQLPQGGQFVLTQLTGKYTRAVEQACNGTYHGDNTLDFGGYSACLAALVSDAPNPQEVVK